MVETFHLPPYPQCWGDLRSSSPSIGYRVHKSSEPPRLLAYEPTVSGVPPKPPAGDEARPLHPLRKVASVRIKWLVLPRRNLIGGGLGEKFPPKLLVRRINYGESELCVHGSQK